jgi:hypothetical protein
MWGEPKDKTPLLNETPKHYKGSKRKPTKKSNHKHNYVHVLLRYTRQTQDFRTGHPTTQTIIQHGTECSICKKTGYLPWRVTRELDSPTSDGFYPPRECLTILHPTLRVVDIPAPW